MSQPLLGHLDPGFLAVMDLVQADLRRLFRTENPFTLPVSGTGSAGMEICLANLVEPGDRVVVGVHGVFGGRMLDLVERLGGEVVAVTAPFGEPLDPAAMIAAVRAGPTRVVAFVHAETSTGVLIDPAPIAAAAREVGALCVLDCVTSLGGTPVDIDGWGVDAAFSGTQKCLSVPPGLSPVTFSPRALERVAARARRPSTWYLDVGLLSGYWGGERVYHHTAPISMIFALRSGLEQMHAEGDDARFARHLDVAESLYRGLDVLGLGCLVPAEYRTPMLTTVALPDDIEDEAALRAVIRHESRIEIGGGLGPLVGRVWRIGLMGHGARPESVARVLTAIGDAFVSIGRDVDVAGALAAATTRRR
jgi:alanine-glyoxylate transaminase / serine-glyoxylate transaminase / serine-pyruvate transaminase